MGIKESSYNSLKLSVCRLTVDMIDRTHTPHLPFSYSTPRPTSQEGCSVRRVFCGKVQAFPSLL